MSGIRYTKHDLILVVLVQTAFDMVSILSIITSLQISLWEFRRAYPDVTVMWLFATPLLAFCQLLILLLLLAIPAKRNTVLYTVFSVSAIVAAMSIQYRLFFLQFDRFVATSFTVCSAVVLVLQVILVALFMLGAVRQRATRLDRKGQ